MLHSNSICVWVQFWNDQCMFQVKKGLDSLYKKVEKHLCDEENLLQVLTIIDWVSF